MTWALRLFLLLYFFLGGLFSFAKAESLDSTLVSTAKIKGFTITANDLSRDLTNDTITLSGHVKIVYQNQYFEADQVDIDFKQKKAIFVGHVLIQTPTYQIGGQKINLDYESNQGIIYVGYVQSNNVRFQGDMIEKINDVEFYVSNADYTTCSNCPATWSFQGSQIKAELGGYAYIKNSFLKVGQVPVFWLPYLVVPLKSERQTGLLTPEFGYINKRKLVFSQDIFWAISRSEDATLTFKNYELGGAKPLVEYRYVLDDNSFGQIRTSFIRDTVFASEERYNKYLQDREKGQLFNRWAVRSYNQYSLDSSQKVQLQVSLVSDLQYPKDFNDEFKNYSDSGLENRFTYSKYFEHSLLSLDALYYKNILQSNSLGSDDSTVHRLPELRFDSTYKKLFELPVYYKIETGWTRFYRKKYYDDISVLNGQKFASNSANDPRCENLKDSAVCSPTEDQVYDENNDLIRSGQRLLFKTSLTTETYTVSDFLNLTPTVSYNETKYYFPEIKNNQFNSRRYVQLDLNTRTKFYKIYDENYLSTGLKYKNEIIPEFQYNYIPWIDQQAHPFFGNQPGTEAPYSSKSNISDADLNTSGGVLFDFEDRVYDRHIMTFSLLDRLVRKKNVDNSYKTLMTFRLAQSYDLYQSQSGENKDQPLSDLSGTLTLDLDQVQSYTQVNYFPYLSATNTTTSLSYLNEQQQYFKIGYASKRTEDPKQDDVSFAIGFVSNYVNVLTGFVFDASEDRDSSSRLKKFSLITQLKPPGDCWAVNFFREQKVGLEAEWKVRFDFSFDGKPTKVIPPDVLNIN